MAVAAAQRALLLRLRHHDLPDDAEVRLVRRQAQHDKVGIRAVEAVPGVRVVLRLHALGADVVHDLVLTLAGNVRVVEDDTGLELLPERVVGQAVVDVVADGLGHLVQEVGAGRDDVGVEELACAAIGQSTALRLPVLPELLLLALHLLALLRGPEPSRPLLVHLGAGGDAVDGHVEQLLGPDDADEAVQVEENVLVHVLLIFWCRAIFRVAAWVDDAVHVEVQVVEITVRGILVQVHGDHTAIHLHGLPLDGVSDDLGEAHAAPPEEGRNPHGCYLHTRRPNH
mmetsp:Transcript_64923/g.193524  ORF Transcript_64923/g.193524 Transcript_64923/m.193524 type:complete len:284 (+) Transcript_64923:2265-3116(+)